MSLSFLLRVVPEISIARDWFEDVVYSSLVSVKSVSDVGLYDRRGGSSWASLLDDGVASSSTMIGLSSVTRQPRPQG